MPLRSRIVRAIMHSALFYGFFAVVSFAQSPAPSSATLHEIHVDGSKKFTEPQIIALTELQLNSSVDRDALQTGADKLIRTGLFAHVQYEFHTRGDQISRSE